MKKRIRISAHMGEFGGNIPGNTFASAEIALRHGADILELDVTKSADDQLFVFHPGMEKRMLGVDTDLRMLTAHEIEKLRFVNVFGTETSHALSRLEDMLMFLRGRCVVNIDKFEDNPAAIAAVVRRLGMQDQVLVKTKPTQRNFDMVAQVAYDLPYMPFVYEQDACYEQLSSRRDMRYCGCEAVFSTDDSPLAQEAYIHRMHELGKEVWVNAIRFSDHSPLAGSRSDDGALTGDPDAHWGWMADTGYDIIQTDWPLALDLYLSRRSMR